jgi:hypothetical protein
MIGTSLQFERNKEKQKSMEETTDIQNEKIEYLKSGIEPLHGIVLHLIDKKKSIDRIGKL